MWLVAADGEPAEKWEWAQRPGAGGRLAVRPAMVRKRSKSDAELPTLRSAAAAARAESSGGEGSPARTPVSAGGLPRSKSAVPKHARIKKRVASSGQEDKWVYKGRVELVDVEVVISPSNEVGDERRLEVLSPEQSFALYAGALTQSTRVNFVN